MEIKTMLVVGMGLMGHGIAQVSAVAGIKTYVHDMNEEMLEKGLGKITKLLAGKVKKGKITE
ncbi:MAG: 3-hydroxybutyryl-CoA dehydrogenase, partial [Deltaproteobacteria bacterium]|nr:3-hydroxybutyryl-CoA dehydrogenase [Deltaproteobacteria bacterium]